MSSSSPLLERLEVETAPEPTASVIWLHGLGADGNDFVPVVPALGLPEGSAVRFSFPNAPTRPITVNGGMVMRGWYDILGMDIDRSTDADGIRESAASIAALVAYEVERGIPSDKIVLAGFSQGGAIALFQGLRHPDSLAGILALSTYLPMPDQLKDELSAANREIPVYMAHGTADPVVPLALAEQSKEAMTAAGINVQWSTWPIPHSVSPEEIVDIGKWFTRVLDL